MVRIINLEDDMPTVDEAMNRLNYEVITARKQKIKVLKVIHGYGSSGKGGKIRIHTRKSLDSMERRGIIKYYVIGEKLSIFDGNTRKAIEYCKEFKSDSDIERHNNGITVVVI